MRLILTLHQLPKNLPAIFPIITYTDSSNAISLRWVNKPSLLLTVNQKVGLKTDLRKH